MHNDFVPYSCVQCTWPCFKIFWTVCARGTTSLYRFLCIIVCEKESPQDQLIDPYLGWISFKEPDLRGKVLIPDVMVYKSFRRHQWSWRGLDLLGQKTRRKCRAYVPCFARKGRLRRCRKGYDDTMVITPIIYQLDITSTYLNNVENSMELGCKPPWFMARFVDLVGFVGGCWWLDGWVCWVGMPWGHLHGYLTSFAKERWCLSSGLANTCAARMEDVSSLTDGIPTVTDDLG